MRIGVKNSPNGWGLLVTSEAHGPRPYFLIRLWPLRKWIWIVFDMGIESA